MKLRGSKTEQEFREELIQSRKGIFGNGDNSNIKITLNSEFPNLVTAYVLHWTPEQCEDIYIILVNGAHLISVELDKEGTANPIVEHLSLEEYKKSSSKINQIKLAVALDLSGRDKNEHNN